MQTQETLVVVCAGGATTRVAKIAGAGERTSCIGTGGRTHRTVVRVERVLVVVCTRNTATRVAKIARARE